MTQHILLATVPGMLLWSNKGLLQFKMQPLLLQSHLLSLLSARLALYPIEASTTEGTTGRQPFKGGVPMIIAVTGFCDTYVLQPGSTYLSVAMLDL